MKRYQTKPKNVSVYTFDEFVQYGIEHEEAELHNGMPWSFDFYGYAVTHEDNECYILNGFYEFQKGQMLVVDKFGTCKAYDIAEFEELFEETELIKKEKKAYRPYNVTFDTYHTETMTKTEAEKFVKDRNQCKGGHWVLSRNSRNSKKD